MLKLYGAARSRAAIVQWYLEELSVPYEFVMLDLQAGEHLQPAYLAINPVGKVPAIVDGDLCLWESGAILLYLADKYDKVGLSIARRAEFAQWILFANATLGPGVFAEASREREAPRLFGMLNTQFEQKSFLVGDAFSVADVAVGSMLNYIPLMLKLDLSAYPAMLNYMHRLAERPAFQTAIGARK